MRTIGAWLRPFLKYLCPALIILNTALTQSCLELQALLRAVQYDSESTVDLCGPSINAQRLQLVREIKSDDYDVTDHSLFLMFTAVVPEHCRYDQCYAVPDLEINWV